MSLSRLSENPRVVGLNAVKRAVLKGIVAELFLGCDAQGDLALQVRSLAEQRRLPVNQDFTMVEIGRACGIPRRAAVAAVVAPHSARARGSVE